MVTARTIAQNTLYLTGSHIAMRLIGLGEVMVLVRYLGPEMYGTLTLAYAYWSLFALIVEAGIDVTLVREASQNPERLTHLVGNGILIRTVIALGAYLIAVAALPWLGYDSDQRELFSLTLILLFFSPLAVARTIFPVLQRIWLVALLDLIGQLLHTTFILSAVFLHGNIAQIVGMQVIATALTQTCYVFYGWQILPRPRVIQVDWHVWLTLLNQSWPILLSSLLATGYLPVSRLIVGQILGRADAGIYTVALSLSAVFNVLPVFYFASVYPLLARAYTTDIDYFRRLYRFSLKIMMVFIFPVALLMSLTGNELIRLYAGSNYLAGTPVFIVMSWTAVLIFAGKGLYYLILATRQQHILPSVTCVLLCIQLGTMVLLVPFVGLVGTALATLIMYTAAFGIYASLTATRIYVLEWLSVSIRPALIVLFIGGGLLILDPPTIVKWTVGMLLYGILIAIFGGMRGEDIGSIRQIIHR